MKIEEQVLSREQMNHLQELGVDTSDASMCWIKFANSEINEYHLDIYDGTSYKEMKTPGNIVRSVVPAYTIGDLIEKLPKTIDFGFGEYDLEILIKGEYVGVQYTSGGDYTPFSYSRSSLIESLYSLLCGIAENHKELLEVRND